LKVDNKIKIIFTAQFSDPINGIILINRIFFHHIASTNSYEINKFDLGDGSPASIKKLVLRLKPIFKLCYYLVSNYKRNNCTIFYLSVSHAAGMYFEFIPWVISSKFVKLRIMHYHTYKYINKKSCLMQVMQKNKNTKNIFLCEHQQIHFNNLYKKSNSYLSDYILSNFFYFQFLNKNSLSHHLKPCGPQIQIGFLSNPQIEKGIFELFEIVRIFKNDTRVNFSIVGPVHDKKIFKLLKEFDGYSNFSYSGPLYGHDKSKWFEKIDICVFPSHFDSFPLVLMEAMFYGSIALSTNVGCIPNLYLQKFIFNKENYVESVIYFINSFLVSNEFRGLAKSKNGNYFNEIFYNSLHIDSDIIEIFKI
jgi:hypothetical protein